MDYDNHFNDKTNTTKVLRQLTSPGERCEKEETEKKKDKNLWERRFESCPVSTVQPWAEFEIVDKEKEKEGRQPKEKVEN